MSGRQTLNLDELERFVLDEIESYRYEVPEGAIGRAFSSEKVERMLAEMRALLVKPDWQIVEIRDTWEQMHLDAPELRECVLVADDPESHAMYYDPIEEDFVLTMGDHPPQTFGVRGDAVGCFFAR